MMSDRVTRGLVVGLGMFLLATPLAAQTYRMNSAGGDLSNRPVRILQTNSAGDQVHVIDPVSMEIVGIIEDIPHNHGATLHADGLYYYITNEHDDTVDIVDTRTLQIIKSVELIATPNNLSSSDRARKVYVAIAGAPWVQVIDMDTNEVIKNIPTPGGVHNTVVTADGRYAAAGMIGAAAVAVIDTETDEVVWTVEMGQGNGVRPLMFDANPDGSTRNLYVQISGWHGFWVVDFNTHQITQRVSPPQPPLSQIVTDGIQSSPTHGNTVLPDGSMMFISSRTTGSVYGFRLPSLEFAGAVEVGNPAWITATPDSRYVWAGVSSNGETAAIDVRTMQVVKRIPVGATPKRIYTAVFPVGWAGEVAGVNGSGANNADR